MNNSSCCAVILAAGEGKRMKSSLPKVMSQVGGKPMISWVIGWANKCGINDICVVAGYKKEMLEEYLNKEFPEVKVCYQEERKGTGHAVMMAKDFLEQHSESDVLILPGDAPFIDSKTISDAFSLHISEKNSATVISAKVYNPYGYGRIVRDDATKSVAKIVEEKDANEAEREIKEINSAAFWFKSKRLLNVLDDIKNNNAQGEYYLPDAIKLLIANKERVDASVSSNEHTVLGANDKEQLKVLDQIAKEYYLSK